MHSYMQVTAFDLEIVCYFFQIQEWKVASRSHKVHKDSRSLGFSY